MTPTVVGQAEGGSLRRHLQVLDLIVAIQYHDRQCAYSLSASLEKIPYLGHRLSDDGGCSTLEDSCFLAGNRFQCVAQQLSVIESDRGNGCNLRLQNVGRVEAAAESGLDDGEIHVVRGEPGESERRSDHEKS